MKFSFSIPVTHKTIVNQQVKQVHIGDIKIEGECKKAENRRVEFDYDSITWNGADIFDLLQYKLTDALEEIDGVTDLHCYGLLYEPEQPDFYEPDETDSLPDLHPMFQRILEPYTKFSEYFNGIKSKR